MYKKLLVLAVVILTLLFALPESAHAAEECKRDHTDQKNFAFIGSCTDMKCFDCDYIWKNVISMHPYQKMSDGIHSQCTLCGLIRCDHSFQRTDDCSTLRCVACGETKTLDKASHIYEPLDEYRDKCTSCGNIVERFQWPNCNHAYVTAGSCTSLYCIKCGGVWDYARNDHTFRYYDEFHMVCCDCGFISHEIVCTDYSCELCGEMVLSCNERRHVYKKVGTNGCNTIYECKCCGESISRYTHQRVVEGPKCARVVKCAHCGITVKAYRVHHVYEYTKTLFKTTERCIDCGKTRSQYDGRLIFVSVLLIGVAIVTIYIKKRYDS